MATFDYNLGSVTSGGDVNDKETKIGVWKVDGVSKPVYEKTLVLSVTANNVVTIFDISSLNIDLMIEIYGMSSASGVHDVPINFANVASSSSPYIINAWYDYNTKKINLYYSKAASMPVTVYLTIRYTKTTD